MAIEIEVWELIRTLASLGCFTVVPGYLALALFFKRDAFEKYLTVPISLGLGLAISVLMSYLTEWAGGSLTDYTYVMFAVDVVGTAVFAWKRVADREVAQRELRKSPTSLLITLLVVVGFIVILRYAPRIGYARDTWFHVAHVRQAIEQNTISASNAFHPDGELSQSVTRWHTILGGVAASARVEAITLWYIGNAYVGTLAILAIYAFSHATLGHSGLSLVSAILFLATTKLMSTSVYPWGISHTLMWVVFTLFGRYVRTGKLSYVLAAVIASVTIDFLHGLEFMFLCLGILAAIFVRGYFHFLRRRDTREKLTRSLIFFSLLMAVGFPFFAACYSSKVGGLINRFTHAAEVSDEVTGLNLYSRPPSETLYWIFPHQGRLIYELMELLPFGALALPLSLVASEGVRRDERELLLVLTWIPVLVYAMPGLSWVTGIVLGEAFSYRLNRMIPASVVLTLALHWSGLFTLVQGTQLPKLGRAALATVLLTLAAYVMVDRFTGPDYSLDPDPLNHTSPLYHRDMYQTIDEANPNKAIVLTDPWTGCSVPALTKHDVLLCARTKGKDDPYEEMYKLLSSPDQSSEEAIASLEDYGIDYVVVNTLWIDELPHAYGERFYSAYTLEFLNGNPKCFSPVFADEVFWVFSYTGCSPSELEMKNQTAYSSHDTAEVQVDHEFTEDLDLVGYSLSSDQSATPGEDLQVNLYWSAASGNAGSYAVWVELMCDYPGREHFYGKVLRSYKEAVDRTNHTVDAFQWLAMSNSASEDSATKMQSFTLAVPSDMVEDTCSLSVYVTHKDQEDLGKGLLAFAVMEKDYLYQGIELGKLRISQQ